MSSKKKDEARKDEGTLDSKSIEALRASNELLSLFMRHSPVFAYIKSVTSTESRILQASDNYQRMLGSSKLDIVGKTMDELFPPEFAAKITADDWAVVKNGSVLQMEKDMDDRSYISIKFPFVQGDRHMLAGYMFDITERKQAESKLQEAEVKLRESMDKLRRGEAKLRDVEERQREDEEKLRENRIRLQEIDGKIREAEGRQRAAEEKLREAEVRLRNGENKLREVEDKLQSGGETLRVGGEKLQEIEDKLKASEDRLQEIEDKLRDGEEKLQEVGDKLRDGEEKQQEIEDKLKNGEEKLPEVEDRLREGQEKLQDVEDKLRDGEERLQDIEDRLREGQEKLQEKEEKLQEIEEKLQADDETLRTSENKLRVGEERLPEVEGKLREGEEKLRKIEDKLRAGEEKLREKEEKLRKEEERLRVDREALRRDREKPRAEGAPPAPLGGEDIPFEVHNQARNNMFSVIALMEMERKMHTKPLGMLLAKPGLTDAAISALESRIECIALLHERLSQSQNPSRVDLQDYLSVLVAHLRTSLDAPPQFISNVDAAGISLKLDLAVPVGIIVNELVTNAFKYAFPKNEPQFGADKCEIKVSLERKNNEYTLAVEDNGTGLPKMNTLSKKPTLGLRLVRMLGVDQLGGKLTVNRTKGTRFVLKFNVRE